MTKYAKTASGVNELNEITAEYHGNALGSQIGWNF